MIAVRLRTSSFVSPRWNVIFDLALAQIAREADHRGAAARQSRGVDDNLVADEGDDDRRL
jgi:hypothetical protein